MKNYVAFLSILFALPVFAQNHYLGIKGGASWTNVNTKDYPLDGLLDRVGFTGGFTYQYQLNKGFHLGADLVYAQKGFKAPLIYTDSNGNILNQGDPITYHFDYISLPLKAGFSFGNKFGGFANIGFVPSVIVNAQITTPGFLNVDEQSMDATKKVTQYDLGALIEMGGNYAINSRMNISISAQYQQDFVSITTDEYFENAEMRNYGFVLSMGLQYALKAD